MNRNYYMSPTGARHEMPDACRTIDEILERGVANHPNHPAVHPNMIPPDIFAQLLHSTWRGSIIHHPDLPPNSVYKMSPDCKIRSRHTTVEQIIHWGALCLFMRDNPNRTLDAAFQVLRLDEMFHFFTESGDQGLDYELQFRDDNYTMRDMYRWLTILCYDMNFYG